jgi:hypothetical protein
MSISPDNRRISTANNFNYERKFNRDKRPSRKVKYAPKTQKDDSEKQLDLPSHGGAVVSDKIRAVNGITSEANEGSDEENACLICCEPIRFYAVGSCNHREVCAMCTLRLRQLYKENECCICKTPLNAVIFTTDGERNYEKFNTSALIFDPALSTYFEDEAHHRQIKRLWEFECPSCETPPFKTLDQLRKHVKKEHALLYCDLCLADRKVFLSEQALYTKKDLERHMVEWDGGVAEQTRLKGHPLCEFCNNRFYGNDQLYEHLQKNHFTCHICERNGILYQYFRDYRNLERHFRNEHFLCSHPTCLERKFVVFPTAIDLKAHRISAHSDKKVSRADRQLEINFTYLRANRTGEGVTDGESPYRPQGRQRVGGSEGRRTYPSDDEIPHTTSVSTIPPPSTATTTSVVTAASAGMNPSESSRQKGKAMSDDEVEKARERELPPPTIPSTPQQQVQAPPGIRAPQSFSPGFINVSASAAPSIADPPGYKDTEKDKEKGKHREERETEAVTEGKEKERQELGARNRNLIKQLHEVLGDGTVFENFRRVSADFRNSKLSAREYYDHISGTLGSRGKDLIPELISLLPDPEKRAALTLVHEENTLWDHQYPSLEKGDPSPARSIIVGKKKGKDHNVTSNGFAWEQKKVKNVSYTCNICGDSLPLKDKEKHENFHAHTSRSLASSSTPTSSNTTTQREREQEISGWPVSRPTTAPTAMTSTSNTTISTPTNEDFPALTTMRILQPSWIGATSSTSNRSFKPEDFPSLQQEKYSQFFGDSSRWQGVDDSDLLTQGQVMDQQEVSLQEQQREKGGDKRGKKSKKQVLLHFG